MKKFRRIQAIFVALVLMLMIPIATAQASTPVQDARNGVVRIVNFPGDGSGYAATGTGFLSESQESRLNILSPMRTLQVIFMTHMSHIRRQLATSTLCLML